MCSPCRNWWFLAVLVTALLGAVPLLRRAVPTLQPEPPTAAPFPVPLSSAPQVLTVAADPNNLPFSNDRGEGFDNKIAELIASSLNARLEYVWHAQRRGFFRKTL